MYKDFFFAQGNGANQNFLSARDQGRNGMDLNDGFMSTIHKKD